MSTCTSNAPREVRDEPSTVVRGRLATRAAPAIGAVALSAASLGVLVPASMAATHAATGHAATGHAATGHAARAPRFLEVLAVPGYGKVLGNAKHFSLYVLSSERGAKKACAGKCLSIWPPLLVAATAKSVSLGAGVTGHVGFVKRSATAKQVTLNGYPLFYFAKDTGPGQSHGEGIVAFGGTWTLVRPSAKTAAATPVRPAGKPAKTTTGW